jgi:stress response protein YsnF
MIKQRLMEMKNTYDQMIKLRKENLDTFKKKEMSKLKINIYYNLFF